MISARLFLAWIWYTIKINAGYIYGKCGVTWTAARQRDLEKNYKSDPAKYANYESGAKYGAKWIGHKVFDCANLLRWAAKQCGLGTVHSSSNLIWKCDFSSRGTLKGGKRTDGQPLLPGTAVLTGDASNKPHIGVYVGNGDVVEAQGTKAGVVVTKIDAKTSKGGDRWTYWEELKGILLDVADGEHIDPAEPAENAPSAPADNPGDNSPTLPDPAPETPKNDGKPTLRKGDRGDAVKEAQTLLIRKGYSCGTKGADGIFGKNTEAAVRQFQTENGLTADGVIGAATWAALTTEPVEYTVIIPGLSSIHAQALVNTYPGATMTEERGN